MYNTNFVVRYRDIEYELVNNLHRIEQKKQEMADIALLEKERQENAAALLEKEELKKKKGRGKKGVKNEVKNEEIIVEAVPIIDPGLIVEPKKRGRKKAVVKVVEEPEVKEPIVAKEVEDDEDTLDIEYTIEDVHLICEKLYRDELLSVFEVESSNDPNMDTGIKRVIEKMIDNVKFKQLLEDIKHEIIDVSKFTGTPEEIANMVRNSEYLIFITLFSQHVFYITHRCICQLFTANEIDPELMAHLKNRTIGLFKR